MSSKLLAVIAVPELDDDDRTWIEAMRAVHDSLHSIVPLHFTLMFPAAFDRSELIDHASEVLARTPAIPFALSRAVTHRQANDDSGYVFLIPGEGANAIVRLHDELYHGDFARFELPDQPYRPHVTIARDLDPSTSAALTDDANATEFHVAGCLVAADIVRVTPEAVHCLRRVPLGTHTS